MSELYKPFVGHDVPTLSELRSCLRSSLTGRLVRRITTLALREFYSVADTPDGAFADLACYTYPSGMEVDEGDPTSKVDPFRPTGIYVLPGDYSFESLGMGFDAGNSPDNSRQFIGYTQSTIIEVHHMFPRLSTAMDFAEKNVGVVLACVWPLLARAGAKRINMMSANRRADVVKGPTKQYNVVLSFEVSYTPSVARSLESHRLRKISPTTATA